MSALKNLKSALAKGSFLFLELLFPRFCAGCKREGTFLCAACESRIPIAAQAVCLGCRKRLPAPVKKCSCKKSGAVTALVSPARYESAIVRSLIADFKYKGARQLQDIFDKWLAGTVRSHRLSDFLVVPVPLHKKRLRERGFNQAALLAKRFAEQHNLALYDALLRVKATASQTALSKEARAENVQDAFMCPLNAPIAHQHILLVDDVATTGATLQECAKVLKKSGAKSVWALTIAR